MSKNFLVSINLNGNELQNAVVHPLAAAPSNPKYGQIYLNSTDNLIYFWNGTSWAAVGAVLSVNGQTGVVTLGKSDVGLGNVDNTSDSTKKTNFTGSIADNNTGFVTGNDVYDALALKLNLSGGTMSGNIAMGSHKITGLAAPTSNNDAATKKYADDLISNLGSVFTFKGTKTSTSNLPLTGNKQGDVWLVTDDNSEYVWTLSASSGTIDGWEKLGVVVDLSGYATLASPAFTGTPTAPTATAGTNSTQIATTAFVKNAIDSISGTVKTETGTIGTSATSVSVNFTGTVVNAYAKMGNNIVVTDISIGSSSVTFTLAAAPSSSVTCVVVYI